MPVDAAYLQQMYEKLKAKNSGQGGGGGRVWWVPDGMTQVRPIWFPEHATRPLEFGVEVVKHKNVGPESLTIICPRPVYGMCGICEYCWELDKLDDQYKKLAGEMWGKRNFMMQILVRNEESQGIRIAEVRPTMFAEVLRYTFTPGYLDMLDPYQGRDGIMMRVGKNLDTTYTYTPLPDRQPLTTDPVLWTKIFESLRDLRDVYSPADVASTKAKADQLRQLHFMGAATTVAPGALPPPPGVASTGYAPPPPTAVQAPVAPAPPAQMAPPPAPVPQVAPPTSPGTPPPPPPLTMTAPPAPPIMNAPPPPPAAVAPPPAPAPPQAVAPPPPPSTAAVPPPLAAAAPPPPPAPPAPAVPTAPAQMAPPPPAPAAPVIAAVRDPRVTYPPDLPEFNVASCGSGERKGFAFGQDATLLECQVCTFEFACQNEKRKLATAGPA